MSRVFQYYGKVNGFRGNLLGLPPWARLILTLAALPGIVCLALSFVAIIVSLFALLVLVVPVYRILQAVAGTGGGSGQPGVDFVVDGQSTQGTAGRRHVEAKIIEAPPTSNVNPVTGLDASEPGAEEREEHDHG